MTFEKISPDQWDGNPFTAIGKQWYLLTAGTAETGWNCMTCSWGAMGIMWNQPTLTCYVRHSRHTYGFMQDQDTFTISLFPEEKRRALSFCGAHSGRDCDKAAEAGLHPVTLEGGAVSYEEAETVFVCRKRFSADLKISELPKDVATSYYSDGDTHRMYLGEILAVYQKNGL